MHDSTQASRGAARRAIIIGSGVAGPVMAMALQKANIEASVYEAYSKRAEGVGAMLTLAQNGIAALGVLGIELGKLGRELERVEISFGADGPALGFPAGGRRQLRRADLYSFLNDCAERRGLAIHHGKRLTGVEEQPESIRAQFADGTTEEADILIGADGVHSTVRRLIDPAAPEVQYAGYLSFFGVSRHVAEPDRVQQAHTLRMCFARGGFVGRWAAPDGGTAYFVNLPYEKKLSIAEAKAVAPATWLSTLREAFANDPGTRELIEKTLETALTVVGPGEILTRVPHWYRGRMVLVGDAALTPSSSSGQGASLAIESAIELARCLRDVSNLSVAFAAYEDLRRERVEKIAAQAARQNLLKQDGVLGSVLRRVFPLVGKHILNPEKIARAYAYRIDWTEAVRTSTTRS